VRVAGRAVDHAMYALSGVLIAGHLLQLAAPLRLNTDSYRLLSIAVSAVERSGFVVEGRSEQCPTSGPRYLGLAMGSLACRPVSGR
jgi:hypothetical protein